MSTERADGARSRDDHDDDRPDRRLDDVPAPADADACGALGCRRAEDLRRVRRRDGRGRVLCPDHARYFVEAGR